MVLKKIQLATFLLLFPIIIYAGDTPQSIFQIDPSSKITGDWFLAYNYNRSKNFNQYGLKRGYFTIKTKLNEILSTRYTQDITLDQEGGDAGNVETRLKYLYIEAKLQQFSILKNSSFEFGLVHRPWLDFDGHINHYRVQGKMFAERHGIVNSADFGITYSGLIGGKINKEYQQRVSASYPGKYGSFALGVYNGGGYHAIEKNNNKTVEGRLTLRPFFKNIPGLQLTYSFAAGKANLPYNKSDFAMNLFYLSYESESIILTAQYYTGKGDYEGNYVDYKFKSHDNSGYSIFSEIIIPNSKFSVIGRYDSFISDQINKFTSRVFIGGLAYKFLENKVLIDYNRNDETGQGVIENYEIVLEISF